MNKIILVTGVAGFIGSNLTKELLNQGHTVVGIDNFSYGNENNMSDFINHSEFTFIHADLCGEKNIILDIKFDYLVHLASQKIPRYTSAYKTIQQNDLMTYRVIEACLKNNAKLIFASTSDIYGKNPDLPYHEESNSVLGSTHIKRWAYAVSKLHSEHYIIANHEEKKLKYTIMRFFGSYGPNQNLTWWGGPQSIFAQNILEGKKIEIHGDGLQTRTFTFVEDTVQGIIKCIFEEKALNEVFNIASEPTEEITIKDLGILICKLLNVNPDEYMTFIPYSTFGKYEDVMRRVPDISKIKNQLGYQPNYNLEQGLEKTLKWQVKLFEK